MTNGKLLFLGTGGSMGVPVPGCQCDVCLSGTEHNQRFRPSALLSINGKQILIDTSPDLRMQALKNGIQKLDGVILTHAHNDHTAGLDDLRSFYRTKEPVHLMMSHATYDEVKNRFFYFFDPAKLSISLRPNFSTHFLSGPTGTIDFLGIRFAYFTYLQLGMQVTGLRVGDLAYITDIHTYSESVFEHLDGIHTLIISALRFTPSKMHLSVDEAIAFSKKTTASKTWLTHISHELDHERTNAYLPDDVRMAYDGLEIVF